MIQRLLPALLAIALVGGCRGFGTRTAVITPASADEEAVLMDFGSLELDPLSEGWHRYRFIRHKPMSVSVVREDGKPALRAETNDTASMLFRHTDVELSSHPYLLWEWKVVDPISSELDESTPAGDDHPARFFMEFRDAGDQKHYLEIIYGNELLAGDYKTVKGFPHYVARGGKDSVGRWHDEVVDLREIYEKSFGSSPNGARLTELAVFCDSDNTNTHSLAYFGNVAAAPETLQHRRRWQRTQIDARARKLEPVLADAEGYSAEGGTLYGYFDGEDLLKIRGELLGERGRVDVESYYDAGTLILVAVTQSLYDRPVGERPDEPMRVTWRERNFFFFDETGTLDTATDKDGNEMTGPTAERARQALLGELEVETWPSRVKSD